MGKTTDNSRDITIPTMLAPLTVPQIIVVSTAFVTVIYSPSAAVRSAHLLFHRLLPFIFTVPSCKILRKKVRNPSSTATRSTAVSGRS